MVTCKPKKYNTNTDFLLLKTNSYNIVIEHLLQASLNNAVFTSGN